VKLYDIKELRLKVYGNRVLRRIFGPKRDGGVRDWGEFHNEELHDFDCYQV
jgi:hypothetical protein